MTIFSRNMGHKNQGIYIFIVGLLAVVPPSPGQFIQYDSATPAIGVRNSSSSITDFYKSEVQICKAYQCTGREQCPGKEHNSSVCNCDRDCALYNDCCWTVDSNCSDGIKYDDGATTPDACTFMHSVYAENSNSISIKVGYFMVATCPSYYPSNSVKLQCQEELPLFSEQSLLLDEYIHHVPVFSLKNKKNYRNGYCARCNDVEYKDMRFWQLETTCDGSARFSKCGIDHITFTTPLDVDIDENILRGCVRSEINSCSSGSSEFYELCASYAAVTIFKNMTFRNPHCAICYDPDFFPGKEICPYYVDLIAEFGSPVLSPSIPPHLVPFDFSVFDETNMPFRNATCALGLFHNLSSGLCDFAPGSMTISLTDCLNDSSSEVFLRLKLNNGNLSFVESNSVRESLTDVAGRFFPTLLSDINYSAQEDGVIILGFRLQKSFLNFEEFFESANSFVQGFVEYHGLSIELKDVAVQCNSSSMSASCQRTSRLEKSDIVLFTHKNITSAKVEIINRVYSGIAWEINSKGVCTDDYTCEKNVTITICDWVEECPFCPFVILTNNSFTLEENENGFVHLKSTVTKGAVPPSEYVILANETALVCLEYVGEQVSVLIWIISITFTTLSLLSLLLTFVTYCTFKSLRNLPGKITMNFVVSLFVEQIILILSSVTTTNYTFCHVTGIFGHYLGLSTFLWMSLIAYDVGRTFGRKSSTMRHVTDGTRIFIIYLVIGWVAPFMFVVICVIIQHIHIHNLEFAYFFKGEKCWLSPDRANFILFGIPAILCLCFNFITFLVTVRGLHHSKVNSRKVKRQMSSHAMVKEEMFLFLKVSVLMGLSWIWAILYGFYQEIDLFLYLHSILNPLQGFFLFCIYVCNRRVLSLWRSIFQRFKKSKTSKIRNAKRADSGSGSTPKTSSTAI